MRGRALRAGGSRSREELRGELVFVQESAEPIASADVIVPGRRANWDRLWDRWLLVERAVRAVCVVVRDVFAQHPLEMPLRDDQDPVETFAPDAADPALRVRLRLRRSDRRPDHRDPLLVKESVEGVGQLDVAVADQDSRLFALVPEGCEHGACLLGDPGGVGVGGDAGDVHAPALELDEEEDIQAAQPNGVDREEVALDDPGCLLAQELAPAEARSSWGGVDAVPAQDVPDRARGEREAEPGQFAVDALVAPARILRRQPEHELPRLRDHRRPALRVSGEAPAAADELAMPAQKASPARRATNARAVA